MSEKTYTAAEVEALLAAERAKGLKPISIVRKSGIAKTGTRKGQAYHGFEIRGNFFPLYVSEGTAAQLAGVDFNAMLAKAVATPRVEPKVVEPTAPRLAPAAKA